MTPEIIRDPSIYMDATSSVTLDENSSWMFYDISQGCRSGNVNPQTFPNFIPYSTQLETTGGTDFGLTTRSPVDGVTEPNGILWNWGQDIYNNQYGLYKDIQPGDTIFEKNERSGTLWVRNDNYQPNTGIAKNTLTKVFDDLSTPEFSNFDPDDIRVVMVFNDLIYIRTGNTVLVEKIRQNVSNEIFTLTNETFISDCDHATNPFMVQEDLYVPIFKEGKLFFYRYTQSGECILLTTLDRGVPTSSALHYSKKNKEFRISYIDNNDLKELQIRQTIDGYTFYGEIITGLFETVNIIGASTWVETSSYVLEHETSIPNQLYLLVLNTEILSLTEVDPCGSRILRTNILKKVAPCSFIHKTKTRGFEIDQEFIESSNLVVSNLLEDILHFSLNRDSLTLLTNKKETIFTNVPSSVIEDTNGQSVISQNHLVNITLPLTETPIDLTIQDYDLTTNCETAFDEAKRAFTFIGQFRDLVAFDTDFYCPYASTIRPSLKEKTIATGICPVEITNDTAFNIDLENFDYTIWTLPFISIPLKNYQNHNYNYGCQTDFRDYDTVFLGVPGFDYTKPLLSFRSNFIEIPLKTDTNTTFVYPESATPTPLSASDLLCEGSVAGDCPNTSDSVKQHEPTQDTLNQDFYCSWLSGSECNGIWVDRYIETANNRTQIRDISPSEMILTPSKRYTFSRVGGTSNQLAIDSLSSELIFHYPGFDTDIACDVTPNSLDGIVIG